MANYKILKPFIKHWEGGFSNDPQDLGGATNSGITLTTFRHYFGSSKTVDDLKKMTEAQWDKVFIEGYWNKWKGDKIKDQSIANILVDWVWASGSYGITKVQAALGLKADGIVGEKTLQAINSSNAKTIFQKIKNIREQYIESICKKRPANMKFRKGWLNRLNSIGYGYLQCGKNKQTF